VAAVGLEHAGVAGAAADVEVERELLGGVGEQRRRAGCGPARKSVIDLGSGRH
jgi:hypothetical protein